MPQPLMLKKMKLTSSSSNEDLQDLLELTPKKRCPFHHRGSDCKSRNSRDTGVTGKFGHGVQNEAGQRLTEFSQEKELVIANTLLISTREDSMHGHDQMFNTEIRLVIFFGVKDGV